MAAAPLMPVPREMVLPNIENRVIIRQWLHTVQQEWSRFPLKIAVIGESGSGKSSFINAMRGLGADDDGAANVCVIEATSEIIEFEFPNNKNMKLVDLPGAGTPTWPRETYIEKIGGLRSYDLFLILSGIRFTETDSWLAKQIIGVNKRFYFVRTKIDQAVENDRRVERDGHDQQELLGRIRANCDAQIPRVDDDTHNNKVYLISNFEPTKYDFPALKIDIGNEFPAFQQQLFNMNLKEEIDKLINKKKESLAKRIHDTAYQSAFDSRFGPRRFYGFTHIERIQTEIKLYQEQFGINKGSLEELRTELGDEATREMQETLSQIDELKADVKNYIMTYIGNENGISKVVLGLTVVGLPINLYKAYAESQLILKSILDKTASTAENICLEIYRLYCG